MKANEVKRNVYVVEMHEYKTPRIEFADAMTTPLRVLWKNGMRSEEVIQFPNPMAQEMVRTVRRVAPVMENVAYTIVEYLDQKTDKAVVQLFPLGQYVVGNDEFYLDRMNRATLQDYAHELSRRDQTVSKMLLEKLM